ncbi:AbrB/MazE/SpoVT family DNA-binding domain-containing protein [Candidatus Woesearchaeota archaeon]|nr:AbrB/MazE/SpoVT family DNA-binding domain-containing protein [Candidatus Woesearchaeota archaeon]
MKKYPKVVQCDKRGQIVIPKDIRQELEIDEGSAFWMYSITDEGILLKRVQEEELSEHSVILKTLKDKSDKIGVKPENIDRTAKEYKRRPSGRLEEV